MVDFVILADHRVKIKESKKSGKCLDLARELKKQKTKTMNIRVAMIPIVTGTIPLKLVKESENL